MEQQHIRLSDRARGQWVGIWRDLEILDSSLDKPACPLCGGSEFAIIGKDRGNWSCPQCGKGAGLELIMRAKGTGMRLAAQELVEQALARLAVQQQSQADQVELSPLAGASASHEAATVPPPARETRQPGGIERHRLKVPEITAAARGQWESLLLTLGITVPRRGKHGPCPVCGGTDRFHFDDQEGRGTWHCRQCDGKQAGDGLDLVAKVMDKSLKETAQEVALALGLTTGGLDDEAIRQRQAQAAKRAEQERQQEQARHRQAAQRAAALVAKATPARGHPYLAGKGLSEVDALRLAEPLEVGGYRFKAGDLLVTLTDAEGRTVNVQLINAQGDKCYLAGGQKAKTFHRIEGGEQVAICEGYATGLSLHLATGATVYCAMDCGNLRAVANLARARHPAAVLLLAGDNDAHTNGNPGKTKAEQAAAAVAGVVALPPEPGDWNDYHQAHGIETTRAALQETAEPANQDEPLPWQADQEGARTLDGQEGETQTTAQYRQRGMTMAKPLRLVKSEPDPRPALAQMAPSQRAELLHERLGDVAIHQASGIVYQHDGILWSRISDDELGRIMADIYDEHQTPYSDRTIVSAVKVLRIKIPFMGEQAENLIGFDNGVYDLKARQFRPHRSDDWLLSHNGIDFNEQQDGERIETHAPHFHQWLNHAADNDPAKMDRIKAALFMILAGRHDWQLFIEVTGPGGSGKSIFSHIASLLVGSHNMASGNTRTLDEARGRAQFVGKRLIVLPDQPKYIGDGSGIKAITGGDLVEIDGKYEKQFSTVLKAVILITNNDPMVFTERNGGIARRRVIFSFERVVPEAQKDPLLGDKIAAELPVIIRHLLTEFADEDRARSLLHEQRASADALAVKRGTDPVLDMCAAVTFLEAPTGMKMGGGKYAALEPRRYLYHLYLEYMEFHGLGKPLSVDRFSTAVRNAAKEYGTKYVTRKVKGRTQTNVQTTDLIDGFMMTTANCQSDKEG